jgi:hypothetical protein
MAGTSNFLQHNPTAANQEDDATYAADSTRTGGIGVDQIMPSVWMNKIWYQASTFIAAFAGALANKGYNLSDANLSTLEAVLANVLTTADTKPPLVTVAFSPTPTFNAGVANGFDMVLTGNVTSSALVGQTVGQIITFCIKNTGSFSFVFPSSFNGAQAIAANTTTIQAFIVREDGTIWPYAEKALGFTPVQQGTGVGQLTNLIKMGWSGTALKATVDTTDLGALVLLSQFVNVFAANGSAMLPGGLILKWGHVTTDINGGTLPVSFNAPFPNNCYGVYPVTSSTTDRITYIVNGTVTTSGFTIGNNGSSGFAFWFAIGN